MLKNYILTSWRNIITNPFIYLLNVLGLAIGIAAFLFIGYYAYYEFSFDRFHKDADRIYRVNHIMKQEGQESYYSAATFPRVGPALVEEFPQVEAECRLELAYFGGIAIVDDKPIEHQQIYYAENSFFELFSFPFIRGDRQSALIHLHTAVLSEEVALQHFGTIDCVGEQITINTVNGSHNYMVTGVFDNSLPSHMPITILLSFPSLLQAWGPETDRNWRWFDFITYVRLAEGASPEEMDKQFPAFIDRHGGERLGSSRVDFDLIPLRDIHLRSNINQEMTANGDLGAVQFLLIIGIFILTIAWINYINLYTAKASERSREVGIRKALGSSKKSLITQFFVEAAFVNCLAVLLGFLGFVVLNIISERYLGLNLPSVSEALAMLAIVLSALMFVSVFFSGAYPAIYISRFRILPSLRGDTPLNAGSRFRKGLVIFQFMASGFMIGGTIVVYSQLQFMNSTPTGVDTTDTIVLKVPDFSGESDSYTRSIRVLQSEIAAISGVSEVSISSDVPGAQVGWRGSSILINKPNDRKIVYKMTLGEKYLSFLKVDFISGRNFLDQADSLSVVINEEARLEYGFDTPESALNQYVTFAGMDTFKIVGVIDNFYQESLKEAFKPTVYFRINDEIQYMSVRVDNVETASFLKLAEASFLESFPDTPFQYHFMDDLLAIRHQKEHTFNQLFNAFSGLAIFISFLGLLGLAFFTTTRRRKEAGIRKVLGASGGTIIRLVFSDFAKLVVLGNLIMVPILWRLATNWLGQFSFHIQFSWLIPLITILLSLLFAFIFTFFHLNKLSKTNPAEVLKYE